MGNPHVNTPRCPNIVRTWLFSRLSGSIFYIWKKSNTPLDGKSLLLLLDAWNVKVMQSATSNILFSPAFPTIPCQQHSVKYFSPMGVMKRFLSSGTKTPCARTAVSKHRAAERWKSPPRLEWHLPFHAAADLASRSVLWKSRLLPITPEGFVPRFPGRCDFPVLRSV